MNVLFMGNLKLISRQMLSKFEEDYKCIIYDERETHKLKGKNIINYLKEGTSDEELSKVFATFDFDTVIFFSSAIDGAVKVFDELEKLESVIHESRKYNVKQFIYITTNDLYAEGRNPMRGRSRETLLKTCDHLCQLYAEENRTKFLVLKIPYLYSMESKDNQLMRWIIDGNRGKKLKIRGSQYSETDFLCEEELAELLIRILDEPVKKEFVEMFLSGENPISYEKITDLLRAGIPNVTIEYENHTTCIPCCKKNKTARTEYGWFHSLPMDEMLVTKQARTIELLRESHMTFIGPKCPIACNEEQEYPLEVSEILKNVGYRYGVTTAQMTHDKLFGTVSVKVQLKNYGVAPMYFSWPVCLYFLDEQGKVLERQELEIDLTKLGQEQTVTAQVKWQDESLKKSLPFIAIGIENPETGKPEVYLDMNTRVQDKVYILNVD